MYEMLTGQLPFKREYEQAIIYSILSEEVEPITSIRSDINPELDQLVLECLIKDQKNRCQSAAEICRKLKFMAGASGLAQYKTESRKKIFSSPIRIRNKLKESPNRKWKWIAASVIAVMAVIIAFLIVRQNSHSEGIDLSKYKFTPIATDAEPESNPAWSPDGQNLAYLKVVNGYSQIFIRNIEKPLPKQISFLDKQNAGTLFWSPDGNLIYFISEGNLYSIEAAGGEPKKIINSVYAATISPDSRSIAYWDFEIKESEDSTQESEYMTSVFIYSLTDDSKRQYLPAPFEVFNRYDPNYIQFSPDGKKIALSIYGNNAESAEFWILPWPDGENSKPYKVFEELKFRDAPQFSWMPDSRNILISPQGSIYDDKMFIGDIETGKSYCIATPVSVKYNTGNVSPDGKKIAFTIGQDNLNIVRIPLDGSRPEWIITTSYDEYSLSFSNSGDKSIYITNKNGFDEIWLRNNEEDIKPIVTKKHFPDDEEYFLISANISPDGSQIAFIAEQKSLDQRYMLCLLMGIIYPDYCLVMNQNKLPLGPMMGVIWP